MKYKFLALAVCLSMTTIGAAFANVAFEILPIEALTSTNTTLIADNHQIEEPKCPKQTVSSSFDEKAAGYRENLYTKLSLTKCQREKAEALHQKNKELAEPLFAKFHEEKAQLHKLRANKACPEEIQAQNEKVKAARTAIREHVANSRKDFESILTPCQLAKYKELKKAKCSKAKTKYKKHCHCNH